MGDDAIQRAKAAAYERPPKEARPDPALAPRRARRAAKAPDTWGSVFNRWLARGHDHGSAAYEADKWEARHRRKDRATPPHTGETGEGR